MSIMSLSTTTSYEWVMSGEYYVIVHNNILRMGDEWWLLYHCPQQHLMNGWWVVSIFHCPQQHLMNGWWAVIIISLSTTTSYEWVMIGEYYISVRNNVYMNGWWVVSIISLPTTTSIEWVMSGEYYIIVHTNILWMRDESWLLYHCPQQHLMNGRWAMIIISLSTATSYEWVMSGDYYIIAHNKIYWMGDEWWVLYHCPKQHLMNGWWVVIIISLSTTTSYEWAMSNDYYIIVHSNILWMGDEWGVLYHCSQQHLMNGRWAMIIISLSTATSYEWVMSRE